MYKISTAGIPKSLELGPGELQREVQLFARSAASLVLGSELIGSSPPPVVVPCRFVVSLVRGWFDADADE